MSNHHKSASDETNCQYGAYQNNGVVTCKPPPHNFAIGLLFLFVVLSVVAIVLVSQRIFNKYRAQTWGPHAERYLSLFNNDTGERPLDYYDLIRSQSEANNYPTVPKYTTCPNTPQDIGYYTSNGQFMEIDIPAPAPTHHKSNAPTNEFPPPNYSASQRVAE